MDTHSVTLKSIDGCTGRLFTAPTVFDGKPVALGRNHASWFLVFQHPNGTKLTRAVMCLNFIPPDAPQSASNDVLGIASPPRRFTIGGTQGLEVFNILHKLRDRAGRRPITVVEMYEGVRKDPMMLRAVVQVTIPEEELIRVCARCGRWEATSRPRFRRCGRCKSNYYCSEQCQKDDWKPGYHKDECPLLGKGKTYEAERLRNLHDNGWWFNHGALGPENLTGLDERKRAINDGDKDALVFGRRTRPHDVPAPSKQPASGSQVAADNAIEDTTSRGNTPGGSNEDTNEDDDYPHPLTAADFPPLPPLPPSPGFVPTGDPFVDEKLLKRHVQNNLTTTERLELRLLFALRAEVWLTRRQLASDRWLEAHGRDWEEGGGDDSGDESAGSMPSMPSVSESDSSDGPWYDESDDEDDVPSDSENGEGVI